MVENSYNPYYRQMPFEGAFAYYGITPAVKKESEEESQK